MKYFTRRLVKPTDLNTSDRLFGGQLLGWIDEEAAIYASCQMKHDTVVTKYLSEIDFKISARMGDILEFGLQVTEAGRTSLTLRCKVRQKKTHATIITIERIVFVAINDKGKPIAHGYTNTENSTNQSQSPVVSLAG